MATFKHLKTGGTYEVITHDAGLQCSSAPEFEQMFDDDTFTIYRSMKTGAMFIRPTEEFLDGRFEKVDE